MQAAKRVENWDPWHTLRSPSSLPTISLKKDFDTYIKEFAAYLDEFPEGFIIIDGLDECKGESEQSEIVNCILNSARRSTLLRWLIFSRPEPHLRSAFEHAKEEGICWIKEIHVDSPEMQRDVKEYMEKEFRRIAMAYINDVRVRDHWPSPAVMTKLLAAISGLFIYAVTIIKFIGDPMAASPVARLQMVIEAIEGVPLPEGAINPIGAIDTLYRTLIERTPSATLPLTLDVLGMLIVCPLLPPLHFAYLLEVDSSSILNALSSLHSVVAVPSSSKVGEMALHYYHASFADFLINASRAGNLHRSPTVYRNRLVVSFLRILSDNPERMLSVQGSIQAPGELDIEPLLSVFTQLLHITCQHLWQTCTQISSPEAPFLKCTRGSEPFEFVRLRCFSDMIPAEPFLRFLRCLYQSTRKDHELRNLVRTRACSIGLDSQFIDACEGISQPLDLEQDESPKDDLDDSPRYVLLGRGRDTVLILAVPEAVMIYSSEDLGNI
ncbi:hypothetical protein NP233_g12633 [Leucocoprinus birnbaumii]|uniref:NACHT domain-containing protein n=1 Tax=Leucocoprinus birnbaumii TaxID=56174 RepID=A0AAD5VG07_9AGAR|nr:hypothetical protein NP233_g12633 [Leucocoprinus birnbaumii]